MSIKIFSRVFKVNMYISRQHFLSTSAILREEKIKIGNYNINYVKVGTGPHTVLCLPGVLGTIWTDFKPQVEGFDRNQFTLVVWEAPGYGKSRPPENECRIDMHERNADYVYYFMKALNIKKYSLLGWSAGGVAAIIHAAKYPEVMGKLVFWGANSFILPQEIELIKKMANRENWSQSVLQLMVQIYGKDFNQLCSKWISAMVEIYEKKNGNLCLECLRDIKCPTFILHGENDPIIDKSHVTNFRKSIKGSRTHVYPKGKHNIHIKYAEDFNKRVQEFLLN